MLKVGFRPSLPLRPNGLLQVVVQVFVRIVFRRVGRKKEQTDLILTFLHPISYDFPMVNLEVVKNDVNLPVNILEQPFQELNQFLLIDAFLAEHKV